MKTNQLKVALVCDWLTGIGGAERVVYELHNLYPSAPIYTSQLDNDPKNWKGWNWLDSADIKTSWLQKFPTSLKKFLPILRAFTFPRIDLSEYDLVISSTGAEAKSIKTGPNTIHICYCHSPTHYYWIRYNEYLEHPGFPVGFNFIAKLGLRLFVGPMRKLDKRSAKNPDYIITNSYHTQNMIKRFYNRDSIVIHPPVDVERFKLKKSDNLSRHGLIVVGRQTAYKRFDLAIVACNELKVPLLVVGSGPDHSRLEKMAGKYITFLNNVDDIDMPKHLKSSLGFIMPNVDDFGISAVEALSSGTPVIAYKKGGTLDYVVDHKNGLFFDKQNTESLKKVIIELQQRKFDYIKISEDAQKFSADNFRKNISEYIKDITG